MQQEPASEAAGKARIPKARVAEKGNFYSFATDRRTDAISWANSKESDFYSSFGSIQPATY